ncbi:MAG: hypothetical protein HDR95_08245 [Bacteroides sp.]|nr:hypothetical protein [Bacteroides sp.]MBD5337278.1 hypothetical protein [Bacteroides sp.]
MKFITKILSLLIIPAAMATVTSCDKDDDKVPANLYQQYEVLVENGNASAFANLRVGGASGERVKVSESRLTVNMLPMYFDTPVSATDPEYTFFATLSTNHTKAVFRFKNSAGKTLVNTSDFDVIDPVTLVDPSIYDVTGGQKLKIELGGAFANEVDVWLKGSTATSEPIKLNVIESMDFTDTTAEIVLPADLIGIYDLILDRTVVTPVTEGDGTATGEIKTVIRSRKSLKFS